MHENSIHDRKIKKFSFFSKLCLRCVGHTPCILGDTFSFWSSSTAKFLRLDWFSIFAWVGTAFMCDTWCLQPLLHVVGISVHGIAPVCWLIKLMFFFIWHARDGWQVAIDCSDVAPDEIIQKPKICWQSNGLDFSYFVKNRI